jgi:four helix bundle protein
MPVYLKTEEFSTAATATLRRPEFAGNRKHRTQISEALDSITSNMSEGYEQSTDAAMANCLFVAKGLGGGSRVAAEGC